MTGFVGSECEQLADSCEHCNEPVSLINLENLTSWECISFSWKALLHGISYLYTWSACCTGFIYFIALIAMCYLLLKCEGVVFVQSPKKCCQVFFDLELALLKVSVLAYINTVVGFWTVYNTVSYKIMASCQGLIAVNLQVYCVWPTDPNVYPVHVSSCPGF